MIILVVVLAIAGIIAVKGLAGRTSDKIACAGDAVEAMTTIGAVPCGGGGDGTGGGIPGTGQGGDGTADPEAGPNGGVDSSEVIPGDPSQPGQGQPGQGQPGQGQPGQGQPGQGQPGQGQPGQGQPGQGQPGQGQPGQGQPGQGQPGQGQPGQGQPGQPGDPSQPGQTGDPAAGGEEAEEEESDLSVGGEGKAEDFRGTEKKGERVAGGAPAQTPEEAAQEANKKGPDVNAEVGFEKKLFEEEAALGQTTFAGGDETLSGGFVEGSGSVFGKASVKDGVELGGKVEGKASAVNLKGEHELPGGIQESHTVDVLSVKGSLEAKAGISKDVVGATAKAEVGANLVEAEVEAKKEFRLPFLPFGIEVGGGASGAVGANASAEGTAGFFRGEDGKSRVGFSGGFKAALGLGLGGKLSLNLVF